MPFLCLLTDVVKEVLNHLLLLATLLMIFIGTVMNIPDATLLEIDDGGNNNYSVLNFVSSHHLVVCILKHHFFNSDIHLTFPMTRPLYHTHFTTPTMTYPP